MDKEMHHTQCPWWVQGKDRPDRGTLGNPGATVLGQPSTFRLGWAAEEHGVKENPFKSQFTRGVFEAGRQRCREFGTSNTKTLPHLRPE